LIWRWLLVVVLLVMMMMRMMRLLFSSANVIPLLIASSAVRYQLFIGERTHYFITAEWFFSFLSLLSLSTSLNYQDQYLSLFFTGTSSFWEQMKKNVNQIACRQASKSMYVFYWFLWLIYYFCYWTASTSTAAFFLINLLCFCFVLLAQLGWFYFNGLLLMNKFFNCGFVLSSNSKTKFVVFFKISIIFSAYSFYSLKQSRFWYYCYYYYYSFVLKCSWECELIRIKEQVSYLFLPWLA